MDRIPEPEELMEGLEQARAYAEADFSEPHEQFVREYLARFEPAQGDVIDLGCGDADVTIRFARSNPECTVSGLDGSAAMLDLGRQAVADAGLRLRVQLFKLMLPLAEPPRIPHPLVISNSLLHHIADPADLWRTVLQVGAPGAAVFVMDLMRPQTPEEWDALVTQYAADAPPILRRDFRNSLRAAYRPDEVRAQLDAAGLESLHVEAITDRHLVVHGRLPG